MRRLNVILLAGLMMTACAPLDKTTPDTNSGGDHKRDLARRLPLGKAITDRINAPSGDHTDWKYLEVDEAGEIDVNIHVDNPSAQGHLSFYDELGQLLDHKKINGKDYDYKFREKIKPGTYFIQARVAKFETVYTVKTVFEPEQVIVEATPAGPEPEWNAEPRRPRRPRRPRLPVETPVVSSPRVEPTAPVVAAPGMPEPDGAQKIGASIINQIPFEEGKKTRLTFNKGKSHNVKKSARAHIGGGFSCSISNVFDQTSVCFVSAKPEAIKPGARVTIVLK